MKRRFEKMGIKNPEGELMNILTKPDSAFGGYFVGVLMGSPALILVGLDIYFICRYKITISKELELFLFIVYFVIAYLFSYTLLWHKNKYKKYFKEFAKKSRNWKNKWAWISLLAILFPFVFFIFLLL